jgi:hypothetical protein
MDENDRLVERFEANRADTGSVENPGGWLTTVVARECLNALRWRRCNARGPLTLACPIRS